MGKIMSVEIKLPDLGDNIDSGTVVSVFVSEGDETFNNWNQNTW